MNARDKELALQAWTENDWDGHVDIPKLIQLVRADAMETANRAAMQAAEKAVDVAMGLERDGCIYAAEIALLGTDKALSDRVIKAIRARGNT